MLAYLRRFSKKDKYFLPKPSSSKGIILDNLMSIETHLIFFTYFCTYENKGDEELFSIRQYTSMAVNIWLNLWNLSQNHSCIVSKYLL